jgi:hypothetical protein
VAEYELHLIRVNLHKTGMELARKRVAKVVRRTYNRSAVLCPVDTGYMRASGRMMPATIHGFTVIGGVVYGAHYAAAVHEGRRTLVFRAKHKKVLRFKIGDKVVYAKSVRQPARAGRPFLATALQEVARGEGFIVSIG